jgi:hypothetical protein
VTLYVTDWTGSNGAAWPSPWVKLSGAESTVDIQSNRGRLLKTPDVWAAAITERSSPELRDFEVTGEFAYEQLTIADHWWALTVRRSSDGSTRYAFEVGIAADGTGIVYVKEWVNNVDNGIVTGSDLALSGFTANVFKSFRLRMVDTTYWYRLWNTGSTEPSTWDKTGTVSTITAAGKFGLHFIDPAASATSCLTDNFVIDDLLPDYNLTMRPNAALSGVSGWSGAFTDIDEASGSPDSSYLEPV